MMEKLHADLTPAWSNLLAASLASFGHTVSKFLKTKKIDIIIVSLRLPFFVGCACVLEVPSGLPGGGGSGFLTERRTSFVYWKLLQIMHKIFTKAHEFL